MIKLLLESPEVSRLTCFDHNCAKEIPPQASIEVCVEVRGFKNYRLRSMSIHCVPGGDEEVCIQNRYYRASWNLMRMRRIFPRYFPQNISHSRTSPSFRRLADQIYDPLFDCCNSLRKMATNFADCQDWPNPEVLLPVYSTGLGDRLITTPHLPFMGIVFEFSNYFLYKGKLWSAGVEDSNGVCIAAVDEWLLPKHTGTPRPSRRRGLPEEVRIFVWRRDQGRCTRCKSRQNLEFDHIIPVSKGGSDTARNIELLCEVCNRRKGAKIR